MATRTTDGRGSATWDVWTTPSVTTSYQPESWLPVRDYLMAPRTVRLVSVPTDRSVSVSESDYAVWHDESLDLAKATFDASAEAWPRQ